MENETQGQKPKKKKKWLWIILGIFVFILIIAIAGSGGEEKKSSVSTSEEAPTVYSINQDVRVGDVRWKLLDVKDRSSILRATKSRYPTFTKDKITTGKFIEITMEVENLGTEMKTVSNLELVDNKGREFTHASDVSEWIPEGKELFLLSNLNPNMPQQFVDIYEVPTDATGLKIKVGDLSLWGTDEALISLGS
jgi:hypothetical protein